MLTHIQGAIDVFTAFVTPAAHWSMHTIYRVACWWARLGDISWAVEIELDQQSELKVNMFEDNMMLYTYGQDSADCIIYLYFADLYSAESLG